MKSNIVVVQHEPLNQDGDNLEKWRLLKILELNVELDTIKMIKLIWQLVLLNVETKVDVGKIKYKSDE